MRLQKSIILSRVFPVIAVSILLVFNSCDTSFKNGRKPKLIVQITIDGLGQNQYKWFSNGYKYGFRTLNDMGYSFDSAFVDHAITVSHAGHVSIATGCWPKTHGIVDAAYYVPSNGKRILVNAFSDSSESIIGDSTVDGVSPQNVLVKSLGDQLLESEEHVKVLNIGSGNISSLLYAYSPNSNAFWYSRKSGKYVTPTYFKGGLPDWIQKFNKDSLPAYIEDALNWETIVPDSLSYLARPDKYVYEADGKFTSFPHSYFSEMTERNRKKTASKYLWFGWSPILDKATLSLAKQGIVQQSMGQDSIVDYVSIVLSQVDTVNHYYGWKSKEAMDVLLRLDGYLGDFIDFLNNQIGRNNYVMVVTADHGFLDIPEYRKENGVTGLRLKAQDIENLMADFKQMGPDYNARKLEEFTNKYRYVEKIYTKDELANNVKSTDKYLELYQHSYREDRIPRLPIFSLKTFESEIGKNGFMVRLSKGTIIDLDVANHGSPYKYDRYVPLIFMGAGIPSKVHSKKHARTIDIAPSIAKLIGLRLDGKVDGKPLFTKNQINYAH